jgi:hypothetical protein
VRKGKAFRLLCANCSCIAGARDWSANINIKHDGNPCFLARFSSFWTQMDRRSVDMQLLNFVLSHQFAFQAIKRAIDEPTDENITDMQAAIQNMVENERSDARQTLIIWLAALGAAAWALKQFLLPITL